MKVKVKVAQSCSALCGPTDSTVHGILQARILEWVAFSISRGSSQTRDQTQVSRTLGRFFTSWATGEAIIIQELPNYLTVYPHSFHNLHPSFLYFVFLSRLVPLCELWISILLVFQDTPLSPVSSNLHATPLDFSSANRLFSYQENLAQTFVLQPHSTFPPSFSKDLFLYPYFLFLVFPHSSFLDNFTKHAYRMLNPGTLFILHHVWPNSGDVQSWQILPLKCFHFGVDMTPNNLAFSLLWILLYLTIRCWNSNPLLSSFPKPVTKGFRLFSCISITDTNNS